ncbi:hypothetical protein [Cellulomonas fengjieae]|uniref:hypothetical protein n=1 Tax=Cellulomonas fengjieae TaxID=2819978 RepID=UPI001AAFD94E|nr:hypothetical protein [Cellulomonas fengjieae]MBO3102584.1 hypothetical protein [Cellulomonas fengjieae]
MNDRADLANAVIEEFTAPRLDDSDLTAARAFERWRINRAPLKPLDDSLLLAYLLDNGHWTWTTARATVQKINRFYLTTSGSRLGGELVKRQLTRMRLNSHAPLALVEPLRIQEAQQIVARLENATASAPVAALRAGLFELRSIADLAMPLEHCWASITTLELVATADGHELHLPHTPHRISLTADTAAVWEGHLTILSNRNRVRTRIRAAAERVGVNLTAPASTLSDAQWDSYWLALDPDRWRHLRDRAYLLVGLATARRHAELKKLTRQDVMGHADGVWVRFLDGKTGRDLGYDLPHRGTPETPCPADCAACALEQLLACPRLGESRDTDPVFATYYGGHLRPMTRHNGRHRIRAMTGLIDDRPWGSTRSLRAGAATSAYESGMSVQEIAHTLTRHNSEAQARGYIRKTGATGATLQLRIGSAV